MPACLLAGFTAEWKKTDNRTGFSEKGMSDPEWNILGMKKQEVRQTVY